MDMHYQGRSIRRLEDERFLTGNGNYVEDIDLPRQLHALVLRSPHSHAVIDAIDTTAARALAGVHAVFTAADLAADDVGPLPCIAQVATLAPIIVPERHALARERVRHVGDAVAFVVADSVAIAREAIELIEVSYTTLPSVVDSPAAVEPGAPQVWDIAPGNVTYRFQKGNRAATDAAFAAAAHIVELDLVNNRLVVAPLENRAAIGTYDAAHEAFHLVITGMGVHSIRDQLATTVFKVPPERVRVTAPDVGGGFGMKNFLYPEWVLVLFAARRLGRSVKWVGERAEDFVSSAQGRDNHTHARLALDADGKALGLDVVTLANLGAYLSTSGPGSSTNAPSTAMGGVYAIPSAFMDVRGVFSNTVPIDAYRGAGKPEANYIIERLIDRAARTLNIDPVELRRRNLIAEFPFRTALAQTIDCGRFVGNLEQVIEAADHAGFAVRRAEAARHGKLRGMGVACFLETSRGQPNEGAEIRFRDDGLVELATGTQSNGQGHETSFPQIAADMLGLPLEVFRVVQADTETVREGAGHGGARSMHMAGAALVQAIDGAIAKGSAIAARLLQATPDIVDFVDGRFIVRDSDRGITLTEIIAAARDPANLPDGTPPGLDTFARNICDVFTFPSGCHVAEVEIDRDTGALTLLRYTLCDDYGRLINPLLTAGQVMGGITQGIGQAMLEHTVYDPESGQLLSGSLMDYALPRADDLPDFDIMLVETPTKANSLGVKGSGQAGAIGAPQTIVNAVLDALAPLGIHDIDMPVTSERIWRAIRQRSA